MLCGAWGNYGWQDTAVTAAPVGVDPLAQLVDDLVD
jgi:hypothetical protein